MLYGSKSVFEEAKLRYQYGGITTKIIFVNVVLFLFGWSIEIVEFFLNIDNDLLIGAVEKWTRVPSQLSELLYKPYTLFTYQFFHAGLFHLLFNMMVLYYFGKIVSDFIGDKKILPLYLMGGVVGALLFLLLYNTMPVFELHIATLVGASAAIMAILTAAAALQPDMEIRPFFFLKFTIKLKFLAAFLILINVFTVENGNAGGNFAHLGGAAFGYLYIFLYRVKGIDMTKPWNKSFDYIIGLFDRKPKPRITFVNKKPIKKSPKPDGVNQETVDAILDKIAQNGYDSLTKDEKDYLFQASKH